MYYIPFHSSVSSNLYSVFNVRCLVLGAGCSWMCSIATDTQILKYHVNCDYYYSKHLIQLVFNVITDASRVGLAPTTISYFIFFSFSFSTTHLSFQIILFVSMQRKLNWIMSRTCRWKMMILVTGIRLLHSKDSDNERN